MAQVTELTTFTWSRKGEEGEYETKIPTNIHLDLLAAGKIPDPFIGTNEKDVQWVHNETWIYKTRFDAPARESDDQVDLDFQGLDTFATVILNGKEVSKSDNMFVPHRVNITHLIAETNELEIVFEPALAKGDAIVKEKGELVCWNGHSSRVYVRKAQYHYGWDWGPSLVTCGPWKPIRLEVFRARIADVGLYPSLSDDLKSAEVRVELEMESNVAGCKIEIELIDPQGRSICTKEQSSGSVTLDIPEPQLWYPYAYGKQPMYKVRSVITKDGTILDSKDRTFGLRRVEIIQTPLGEGSTFYFKINNIPIFIGGSNWIPGDSFLPRFTRERYEKWIDQAVRGNQNMLRVWGGGIYEDDAFYETCDSRGVLVWQDFCFACGQYPFDEAFLASVKEEATAALKRLRNHPSLVVLAGNNEDYQLASEALHHDMTLPESEWMKTSFGARHTYERLLPDLVKRLAPSVQYRPGCPFGGEDNDSDRTVGDVHIWNVSSGMLLPYQRYPDIPGRFVSEFGMLSCPDIKTVIEAFFSPGTERKDMHPQSEAMEFHCKAGSYEKRMFTCMGESVRMDFDLETYVYLTQLVQSEAMGYAYRGWRRKFEGRECGGAIVWQTNDCWPVTSWAIVDCYLRPKLAYHIISRAMKPITVGVLRRNKVNLRPNLQHEAFVKSKTKAEAAGVITHSTPHIYEPTGATYSMWAVNSTTDSVILTAELRFVSVRTGQEIADTIRKSVEIKALGTTELLAADVPEKGGPVVLAARLLREDGTVVAREADWQQPLKHLTFPDRGLEVERDGNKFLVRAKKPVKGLTFQNGDRTWSDNCLDVMPGDEQRISFEGPEEEIKSIYYGQKDD